MMRLKSKGGPGPGIRRVWGVHSGQKEKKGRRSQQKLHEASLGWADLLQESQVKMGCFVNGGQSEGPF